mgnify:CR=1 FL=1
MTLISFEATNDIPLYKVSLMQHQLLKTSVLTTHKRKSKAL